MEPITTRKYLNEFKQYFLLALFWPLILIARTPFWLSIPSRLGWDQNPVPTIKEKEKLPIIMNTATFISCNIMTIEKQNLSFSQAFEMIQKDKNLCMTRKGSLGENAWRIKTNDDKAIEELIAYGSNRDRFIHVNAIIYEIRSDDLFPKDYCIGTKEELLNENAKNNFFN